MKPLLTLRCHQGCKLAVLSFGPDELLHAAGHRRMVFADVGRDRTVVDNFTRTVALADRLSLGCSHSQHNVEGADLHEWAHDAARGGARVRLLPNPRRRLGASDQG